MTPQERQLVDDLFDRLAKLENAPRDKDASRTIAEGLLRAPNAIYPLVQTVLIQDEALKRADARIRELRGEEEGARGGFLDSMRNALTGQPAHGSVPSVRPASASTPDSRWNSGAALAQAAPPAVAPSQGSSFLGTAAASAAGVIGGALLLNSISSMFGHRSGAFAADAPASGSASTSPWGGNAADSDLARDAGVNDIGRGPAGGERGTGLFDSDETDDADGVDLASDFGGDFGGGDSA
jgi:hypothetical protein